MPIKTTGRPTYRFPLPPGYLDSIWNWAYAKGKGALGETGPALPVVSAGGSWQRPAEPAGGCRRTKVNPEFNERQVYEPLVARSGA